MSQRGVIHLLPLIFVIILAVTAFLLISSGVIQNPLKNLPNLQSLKQEPTVSLQTSYKNPFDKSAQYVNPFSAYKNPFDSL